MASAQDAEDALVDAVVFFVGSEAGDARAPVLQSYIGSQARVVIRRAGRAELAWLLGIDDDGGASDVCGD